MKLRRESQTTASRQERVNPLLQALFLQSNRGKEIHTPPLQSLANRTFTKGWSFRRGSVYDRTRRSYQPSRDKLLSKAASTEIASASKEETIVTKFAIREHSLQQHFDALLRERGYTNIQLFDTLDTGYYNRASAFQVASYGPRLVQIVRDSDTAALQATLACGLSPNPANTFGESLLHMVCRRGDAQLLDIMIEAGTCLQTSDDYGRTPLHDAFWAARPAFGVVEKLLEEDIGFLFLRDKRGSLPLSYVNKKDWSAWMSWFDENIDKFFPAARSDDYKPSKLAQQGPFRNILCEEKKDALPLNLARMVANGELRPEEARIVAFDLDTDPTELDDFYSDSSEDSENDYYGSDDSEIDEEEHAEIMKMLLVAEQEVASVEDFRSSLATDESM